MTEESEEISHSEKKAHVNMPYNSLATIFMTIE